LRSGTIAVFSPDVLTTRYRLYDRFYVENVGFPTFFFFFVEGIGIRKDYN